MRKCIRNMSVATILDLIATKDLENSELYNFDKSSPENAANFRLLSFLDEQLKMLPNEVCKYWNIFNEYFDFWFDLASGSRWVVRWMNENEFVLKLLRFSLGGNSPCGTSNSYTMGYRIDPNFEKVYKLLVLLLRKSSLEHAEGLYTLSKAETKMLTCQALFEKAADCSKELLELLMQHFGHLEEFAAMACSSFLYDISKIYYSDTLKKTLRSLAKFVCKEGCALATQKMEWLVGIPRLKHTTKGGLGFGLYGSSFLEEEQYAFPSTLNNGQDSLADFLLKHCKKPDHMPVVMIGGLLAMMNRHPPTYEYITRLPSAFLTLGRFIDWFPNYLERYLRSIRKPHLAGSYEDNAESALKEWQLVADRLQAEISLPCGQRLLALPGNRLYEVDLQTEVPSSLQGFNFPLIFGKATAQHETQRQEIEEFFVLKESELTVSYLLGQPTGTRNLSLPEELLRNERKHNVFVCTPSVLSVCPGLSAMFNKEMTHNSFKAVELAGPVLKDLGEDSLVRTVSVENHSSHELFVSLRFKLAEEEREVFVPQSAVLVRAKGFGTTVAVVLCRLPGQDWPEYKLSIESVKTRQSRTEELGLSSGEDGEEEAEEVYNLL